MNEKDYNLIEDFLTGELDAEAIKAFRERLSNDPQFKEVYEVRKSMDIFLKGKKGKEALKQQLSALNKKHADEGTTLKKSRTIPLSRRAWLMTAAAVALLIIIVGIIKLLPPQSLYEQYADIPEMRLTQMGAGSTLDQAETAFNKENYSEAYEFLKLHLEESPENVHAQYYLGLAAIESGQFSEAIEVFSNLDEGTSSYQSLAKWWLAMTYLKMEDHEKCINVLSQIPESSEYYKDSQALIQQLD